MYIRTDMFDFHQGRGPDDLYTHFPQNGDTFNEGRMSHK